jgi:hypothetical protein
MNAASPNDNDMHMTLAVVRNFDLLSNVAVTDIKEDSEPVNTRGQAVDPSGPHPEPKHFEVSHESCETY